MKRLIGLKFWGSHNLFTLHAGTIASVAVILSADDICLLAPSRSALARMIGECSSYCEEYCLSFNPKKSKIVVFSKKKVNFDRLMPISLQGQTIEYARSIKYLGTTIYAEGGFSFSAQNELCNFYRASNAILNVLNKPCENVLLHLLYTNCVPTITYASGFKSFSSKDMNDCTVALNDAIRKIFSFHRWESVRELRTNFGYKSFTEIFAIAKNKFLKLLPHHENSVLRQIYANLSLD